MSGEAIYYTHPFKVYGEGTFSINALVGKKKYADYMYTFTAKDIRFITKENTIYIFILDWPGNGKNIKIQNLNSKEIKNIKSVSFLASREKVRWKQDEDGLYITTPASLIGKYAYDFKVIMK